MALGGPKGNPQEFIQFLKGFSENVVSWQHTISTNTLEVEGTYIKSRTAAQVMIVTNTSDNTENVSFFGIWYRDKIIKEKTGWVIKERTLEPSWSHNNPTQ